MFLEDISVFLPFPQLEQQLFEIEPLSCSEPSLSEDYDDFLQTLVQRADEGNSGDSQQKIRAGRGDSSKENIEAEKGKRGRGRPPDRKSLVEKRQEANTRERKRMRALVRLRQQIFNLGHEVTPSLKSLFLERITV